MNNLGALLMGAGTGTGSSSGTFNTSTITGQQSGSGFNGIANSISAGGNNIIFILVTIAAFCGVVGLIVTFIKMMAGGSATKSEAKGNLVIIVFAIIGAFAAMGAVKLLYDIGNGLFTTTGSNANTVGGLIAPILPFLR